MNTLVELTEKAKALKGGQKLNLDDKILILQDISDRLIYKNVRSKDIMDMYGVARQTANEWLQGAYVLLESETKQSREGLRHIHRGQIEHQLDKLTYLLDDSTLELEDKLKVHDRVIKYLDARARTNGLNSETIEVKNHIKPLTINMPTIIEEAEIIPTVSQ